MWCAVCLRNVRYKAHLSPYSTSQDGEGSLDATEFKKLVRVGLQIKPLDMPDSSVEALMEALDDDQGGEISADEIEDFLLV